MAAWLDRTVDRLDRVSLSALLVANGLLCLFVLLAHGSALLLVRSGKPNVLGAGFELVYLSIPIAFVSILLALLAWRAPRMRETVLRVHTLVLGCLAAFAVWYAVDVIVTGVPRTAEFVWNPLFFAFLVSYPVYLVRRTLVSPAVLERPPFRYAHVIAVGVSLLLSALILWRIYEAGAP